jgi:hypothetical protein
MTSVSRPPPLHARSMCAMLGRVGSYGQTHCPARSCRGRSWRGGSRSWSMAVTCASRSPAQTAARRPSGTPEQPLPGTPVQPGRIPAGHSPANQGRVRNKVTPQGVWKRMTTATIRAKMRQVRNKVTPQGVWKRSWTAVAVRFSGAVRNKVTPQGVWKRCSGNGLLPFHCSVRNKVTPQGVWKLAVVAELAAGQGGCPKQGHAIRRMETSKESSSATGQERSETRSRHKAYGNSIRNAFASMLPVSETRSAIRRMETA